GHVLHVVAWHAVVRELEHDPVVARGGGGGGGGAGLDGAEQRGQDAGPVRSCSVNRRRRAAEYGVLRCGCDGRRGAARGTLSRLVAAAGGQGKQTDDDGQSAL